MTRLPLLILLALAGCRAPGPVALVAPPATAAQPASTVPVTNRVYDAVVIRCIDGDTVVMRCSLGLATERTVIVRLYGVDCPELSTDKGKAAKSAAEKLVASSKAVRLATKSDDTDVYGRTLGNVELLRGGRWVSLAEEMRRQGWVK